MLSSSKLIRTELLKNHDLNYQAFSRSLINNIDPECIIGVRLPVIRNIVNRYVVDYNFLNDLPHKYHEENMVHIIMLGNIKEFDTTIMYLEKFFPYMNNWSTCDSVVPISFKNNKRKLLPYIKRWLKSKETYEIRFGIKMLMDLYLDDDFNENYYDLVIRVKSDEYYVNMMKAWYFATALAKQYDSAIKIIEDNKLDLFTHNKTIQKAVESLRVSDEHKKYLKSLRISTYKK